MDNRKKTSPKKRKIKIISSHSIKKVKQFDASSKSRPPIVTLMGHVDHGKTTLLDAIRKTRQVEKEFGGITQHIGAYQVDFQGRKITFIDTPGHAAFAKMRAHGANVTDIVVLVVAANDGVKPQTREALSHIRASHNPFLVAINKIDLPESDIEKVKAQLAEEKVIVESYGGDVVTVEVSAKTGKNLDQLLEMILLVADMQNLQADPDGTLEAVVIETRQDRSKGIIVSLLIKNGNLRIGSEVEVDNQKVRIKAMMDENGKPVREVLPGTPVEVLGFKQIPEIGKIIGSSKSIILTNKQKQLAHQSLSTQKKNQDQGIVETEGKEEKKSLNIIIKADTLGSLEAISSNLADEVEIISQGIGEVTESDVLLAQATGAIIYAFNSNTSSSAKKLAQIEKIEIKTYNIIYKLFEDIEKKILKLLEPTIDEQETGKALIVSEFVIKDDHIAGCRVESGEIDKSLPVHLIRKQKIETDTKIKSLRIGKQDVEKVKKGNECGITFKPKIDFKINDVIISYRILEN